MATMPIKREDAKKIAYDLPDATVDKIMQLRSKGFSNYDISEELDLPYPHVVAEAILLAVSKKTCDTKKIKRRIEEYRMEMLYRQAYEAFQGTGSGDWFDRLLKTSERKSKLLGLDSPVETVVAGKKGSPIEIQATSFKGLTDVELETMKALALKSIEVQSNES